MKLSKRNLLIVVLRRNGESMQNIADITGLSRQGVRHIMQTIYMKHKPSEIDYEIERNLKLKAR